MKDTESKTRDLDNDDATAIWLENPVFAAAGEAACRRLAERHPAVHQEPGAAIAHTGDSGAQLDVLLLGTVRVFQRTPDGREAVTRLLQAPALIGEAELLQRLPRLEDVEAADDVLVATIPQEAYLELLEQHPAAALESLRSAAGERCVATRSERLIFTTLEQRVANLLLAYADCFGGRGDDGAVLINHPLTQTAIARSLGTVRRSVINVVGKLARRGFLRREESLVVLLKPEELERIAAPIRGGLCYGIGMPLDHLAKRQRREEGEVELTCGPGSLVGRRVEVGQQLLIGRSEAVELQLPDQHIDQRHCFIYRGATGSRYWIEDLDSINGTWVNDRQIRRAVLREGDEIRVGGLKLRFQLRSEDEGLDAAPSTLAAEQMAA